MLGRWSSILSHGVYHRLAQRSAAMVVALQVLVKYHARELLHCKGVGHEGRPVGDWMTFSVRMKRAPIIHSGGMH